MDENKISAGSSIIKLRKRTEDFLNKNISVLRKTKPQSIRDLIEDLKIYLDELEVQNIKLFKTQMELENLRDKYVAIYDFAPVGYVTLDKSGKIIDANNRAIQLIGLDGKKHVINKDLAEFIDISYQDNLSFHLKSIFEQKTNHVCNLKFVKMCGTIFYARLESVLLKENDKNQNYCQTSIRKIFSFDKFYKGHSN